MNRCEIRKFLILIPRLFIKKSIWEDEPKKKLLRKEEKKIKIKFI